ncbi:zinc ABC transporter substrate-binding protein [Stappia taiwanensis]|uniref:Zinc ABC transporter substrate-binding protein n=1 Tax=Stappia taiwanensis TaxID=992267 RepID=A0A838XWT9_9HYPH|nr:zinc ABC transporter substrate-binding protein [Stappia taiwanensis]MBA4611280.1 zinc ABC transporter substrate-binding protein [Stappia taiwanensis]GGE87361.1 manganese transporter [Stappia taiwanensis]
MRITKRGVLSLIAGAAMMVVAGGGAPAKAQSEAPLSVVATTGMIADAARQVGGDQVTVQALMGPGVDPHAYRQTRTDIVAMIDADLVLWHGLFLEAQMQSFMHELGEQKPVVAVAEAMPKDLLIAHDDYADKYDPHVWMDPERWAHVVEAVRDALIAARPEAEPVFTANAERHLAEVKALAEYARTATASVPKDARVLLTAHDAFNYFGLAHGFEVLGIQGISTESEAGLNRVAELVDLLVERKVGAVFVESSVSDRNIRALIEGAAAKGHKVVIGGELFSDAMGEEGTYEGTYLGMIDHNVTVISGALGGTVPKGGMRGKLAGS